MIYLDSSVMLAQLLIEDRRPSASIWGEDLISSRLLQYEVWNRIHARGLAALAGKTVTEALADVYMIGLTPPVLQRALEPFSVPLRTLDALHAATMDYLRGSGRSVQIASYDQRLLAAASALGIEAVPL